MNPNERNRAILGLLVSSGLALPPTRENFRLRGRTFPTRTAQRRLSVLEEHGLVERAIDSKRSYRATEAADVD